jgi:PKD repeat protein
MMGHPEPTRHWRTRAVAIVAALPLALSALVAFPVLEAAPALAAEDPPPPPETVSSDPLPAPQINGVVWAQVIVGTTVYVGGEFTTARPAGSAPGANEVTRTHLLAFDVTTGTLLPWAPTLNAKVRTLAASPDGTRLYVGGDFTQVNGATRNRVVAFSTATGAVVSSFAANANNYVSALAATNSTVFLGGVFSRISGVDRVFLGAVNASDGQTTEWAPVTTGGRPYAIEVNPDGTRVAVGGDFLTANGSNNPGYGLVLVDSTVGSSLPLPLNTAVRNAGVDAAIFDLASDGDSFYGSGYVFGSGGNLEGAFRASWATGELVWVDDCHGDTYSVAPIGDVVYSASHKHYCGNLEGPPQYDPWQFNRATATTKAATQVASADPNGYYNWQNTPAPSMLNWFPTINAGTYTGMAQGPWSVTGNDQYVVYGGEFTRVNNRDFQGLVRFANRSIAPNTDGPRLTGDDLAPQLDSPAAGVMRVSWLADWDRDDGKLQYQVIRDGRTGSPVYTTEVESRSWDRPTITFVDTGLDPGSTHTYRIRAIDPAGNNGWGSTVSGTVATTGTLSAYAAGVLTDNPSYYWRLGEQSGTVLKDSTGINNGTTGSGVTWGAEGAIIGDSDTAARFSGTTNGRASGATKLWRDNTFSVEAWVKTTSTQGGKIVGFGSSATGNSSNYDRHVYMNASGQILFGVYPNASRTINGPKAYNDGQWHHVVATMGSAGMALYVDGVRVARNTTVTYGQNYWGYWRIGGDNTWSGAPYLNGWIDEVAIYTQPLSAAQVQSHYTLSGRTSTVPPAPTDVYGAAVYASEPFLYWRLGETTGTVAADASAAGSPGGYRGTPTRGVPGVLDEIPDTAVRFGSADAIVSSAGAWSNPTVYSQEAWFKTTTTSGGKIMGFGNRQTGTSTSYDRHVYMQDDGKVVFGTWTGQTNVITSPVAYNDGLWHHVVASQGADGMKLYLDGALVGTNPQTGAEDYTGYWRVGGDTTWGSSSPWFDGVIDEYAVYDIALSPATISQHYVLGAPPLPNLTPSAAFTFETLGKLASFDASGSSDVDGTIASYAWDFGDGASGTGVTPTHSYTASGTYPVTLTVTDDDGAFAVRTHDVEVTVVVIPPTAAFTSAVDGLDASFDGTGSSDPDGEVVSYSWDFGDGTPAVSGATPTHHFTTGGDHAVTLTVTDDDGATGTVTHTVSTTMPNQAPTASFTHTVDERTVSVTSTSSDPDGTVVSYSWNWGDGTAAGSGATATHAYATGGDYTVTLTVTDDDGATATSTATVTAINPPSTTLASDVFARAVASGWGSAAVGGAWTVSSTSNFSVSGDTGKVVHTAGSTRRATLGQTPITDADLTVQFSADKPTTVGHIVAGITARQVSSSDYYQARVRLLPGGTVALQITKTSSSTVLANATIAGLDYTPGDQLQIRFQLEGTSPTTLKAKVWRVGTTEPTTWQLTTTDTTASLQTAGTIGLESYISASATNAPVTITYDNLNATQLP